MRSPPALLVLFFFITVLSLPATAQVVPPGIEAQQQAASPRDFQRDKVFARPTIDALNNEQLDLLEACEAKGNSG